MPVTEQRSSVAQENLQEVLDADENKGSSAGKQEQYPTPLTIAKECWDKLPGGIPSSCLDPQAFEGNLLYREGGFYNRCDNYAIELDNRVESIPGARLITGNCMKVFEAVEDLYPDMRWICINANPPFGRRWKKADGTWIDSTQATWNFAIKHGNYGFFIGNRPTLEKLNLHKSPLVYNYETRKMSDVWRDMRDGEIGIIHWKHADLSQFTSPATLSANWNQLDKIIEDEKALRPKFNIWLDRDGTLRTYLSVRQQIKIDKQ